MTRHRRTFCQAYEAQFGPRRSHPSWPQELRLYYTQPLPQAVGRAAIVGSSGPDRDDITSEGSSSPYRTRHTEGKSELSDYWLRTVLESTSDVVCVLSEDGTFLYVSPAIEGV